ncbi:citrate lyase subunit beta [Microbulbifer sp. NBRC 101763]|uniref:HpcH/HpaI aldolase/citrate lyase family protein n=1 Tax=unclassified Microbulbifer TaxID=2619833 RepID=UPI0030AA88A1
MMDRETVCFFRSILFVPATRPDRYIKALMSEADVACVDLEDAVAPGEKEAAREKVVDFFKAETSNSIQRALRINHLASEQGLRDMLLILKMEPLPDIVMIPKVESSEEIAWFNEVMTSLDHPVRLIPLVETTKGLENAIKIAMAPNVVAIGFGSADYSSEVRGDMSWDSLLYARGRIAQAAGHANIAAIDGPWLDLGDDRGLLEDTQKITALGFTGKIALHPGQLRGIHRGVSPSEESLRQAQKIVDAYRANRGGVLVVDGRMVDIPVVERAQRLINLANRK